MIKNSPPKGWERLKAKAPFDPKGKQECVHNVNTHTRHLRRMAYKRMRERVRKTTTRGIHDKYWIGFVLLKLFSEYN